MPTEPNRGDKVFRGITLAYGGLGVILTLTLRSWGSGSMFPNFGPVLVVISWAGIALVVLLAWIIYRFTRRTPLSAVVSHFVVFALFWFAPLGVGLVQHVLEAPEREQRRAEREKQSQEAILLSDRCLILHGWNWSEKKRGEVQLRFDVERRTAEPIRFGGVSFAGSRRESRDALGYSLLEAGPPGARKTIEVHVVTDHPVSHPLFPEITFQCPGMNRQLIFESLVFSGKAGAPEAKMDEEAVYRRISPDTGPTAVAALTGWDLVVTESDDRDFAFVLRRASNRSMPSMGDGDRGGWAYLTESLRALPVNQEIWWWPLNDEQDKGPLRDKLAALVLKTGHEWNAPPRPP